MLGPSSPDNTSVPQLARTPPPQTHRRARAHGDFPSSPYPGSGHGTSLEPSKDSAESLVPAGPQGSVEAATASGLPHTSMLPPFSTVPSVTSSGAVLPSRPAWVGTPSISKQHSPRSDILPLLPPSPSSSLAPDSPHSIIFSKPAERPTKVPVFPQTAPTDSSSSQSVANSLTSFADEMNHTPFKNAQDLIGILRLGSSGSSTKRYSELSPVEGPRSVASPTPEFLSSVAEPAHLSPPLAPGSLQLPGGTPSWSRLAVASSPASTQPVEAEVTERVHNGVSLPALKRAAAAVIREAVPPLFQIAQSVAVEVTSRELAPATPNDSANALHLSAAALENSEGSALSAGHTSSSSEPSLPLTTAHGGQAILSGAAPASPSNGAVADFPSTPTFFQPAQNHVSPSAEPKMPTPQKVGHDGPPPAATDFPLSSRFPDLFSTTWTFPLQKENSVTAVLKKNKKANSTVALQTLPSKEIPSLRTVHRFTSDFSTDHTSSTVITTPRRNLPSELLPRSIPSIRAAQTVPPSPSFSNSKSETYAAVTDHSELPVSASKQVTAFPSSTEVYDFSTMGNMKKPAVTDVFWSSPSAETGSLSTEPTISGLLQQTNYDLNGHTINSTSWGTHSASSTALSGLTSAVRTIKPHDFKDTAGHLATAEGFSIQDPVLYASTNQPIQLTNVTMLGNHADILSISNNNYSREFQAAEVEEYPTTSHHVTSPQLQLSARPTHSVLLTSPSLPSTAGLQEMLSDGMDTNFQVSSNMYSSPVINASAPFQSILRYHSTDESPLSTSALLRTPSKVLLASQRPKKWTGAATNAGSLFPGTQKTGMTASVVKASSSSTPIPSFTQKEQIHPFRLTNELAVPDSHVLDPLLTWDFLKVFRI